MENGLSTAQSGAAGFLSEIDWAQPWLAPLRPAGMVLTSSGDAWREAVNAAMRRAQLCNYRGQGLTLVAQDELPAHVAYEAYIGATGRIPTRDNLHDFFNALTWLTWPRVKARLNRLQAEAIAAQDGHPTPARQRGSLRDGLTLFDENAAIVVASDTELFGLLRSHAWQTLLWQRRADIGRQFEVLLFGHALLEKLVSPYKSITAHAWLVEVDGDFFALDAKEKVARLDSMVAQRLDATLRPAHFTPLPVLGTPGWCDRQDPAFYADVRVFRPPRVQRA